MRALAESSRELIAFRVTELPAEEARPTVDGDVQTVPASRGIKKEYRPRGRYSFLIPLEAGTVCTSPSTVGRASSAGNSVTRNAMSSLEDSANARMWRMAENSAKMTTCQGYRNAPV